jgi:hypothetical protein
MPTAHAARFLALLLAASSLFVVASPVGAAPAVAVDGGRFVTTWNTTVDRIVDLHLYGTVDVAIDWGDGASQEVHATRVRGTDGPISHEYLDGSSTHQVIVTGSFTAFGNPAPPLWQDLPVGLLSVDEWLGTGTTDLASAFDGASQLTYVAQIPLGVTDMSRMFAFTPRFNQQLDSWYREVSAATDMSGMFEGSRFNQPIASWDVSHVTDMSEMFHESWFNQPIGGWDVSHVTDMSQMFYRSEFNQGLGLWNVSRVTDMSQMFATASYFDQPIGAWKVSNVTDMSRMFEQTSSFNRDLSHWCVPTITARPVAFDDRADRWTLPRPQWGTCTSYPDHVLPSGTFGTTSGIHEVLRLSGTATDNIGVRNVAVAIRNPATGKWLHRDGTWGTLQKIFTLVAEPGASSTTWTMRRVISAGTYGIALIVADTSGNKNPAPRPWRKVTVTVD